MDDKPQSAAGPRSSGLPVPRPPAQAGSRLPLPRASGPRDSPRGPATPAVATSTTTSSPRLLRPAASCGQLRTPTTSSHALRTAHRPEAPSTGRSSTQPRSISRVTADRRRLPVLAGCKETDEGPLEKSALSWEARTELPAAAESRGESAVEHDVNYDASPLPPRTSRSETKARFDAVGTQDRKARPSLTERTIETLLHLPSSPANLRMTSSFFNADAARRPMSQGGSGSRAGSSYVSDGSRPSTRSLSRPGSSSGHGLGHNDGTFTTVRAPATPYKASLAAVDGLASRSPSVANTLSGRNANSLKKLSSVSSKLASKPSLSSMRATMALRTPSPGKDTDAPISKVGAKTVASRPLKARASVNGLFKKPSSADLRTVGTGVGSTAGASSRRTTTRAVGPAKAAGEGRQGVTTMSTKTSVGSVAETARSNAQKSSAALREQIARAKAAKLSQLTVGARKSTPAPLRSPLIPTDTTFDFGLQGDAVGPHQEWSASDGQLLSSRINQARTSGRLNIAGLGLKQMPQEIKKIYDLQSIDCAGGSWAESVDVTRMVAADNELATIDDWVFPDTDPQELDMEEGEDGEAHLLGGLESLDLHNNVLVSMPNGLARLSLLSSLNLTGNRLTNSCFEVISRVISLRNLKLGDNLLHGSLDACFAKLEKLEVLDLHGNSLSALPPDLHRLSRLRVLNVNNNAFESLPFKVLSGMPLTELHASKNKLQGTLIESEVESLPHLQTLDLSANQITLLTSPDAAIALAMPHLQTLTLSMNRLQALPNLGSCKSLVSLAADENNVTCFPDGFTALKNLRHVDLTSNAIHIIPPEVGLMNALAMLRVSANPLRDKKFSSLTTEEVKEALAERLRDGQAIDRQLEDGIDVTGGRSTRQTEHDDNRSEYDNFATPPTSAPNSPTKAQWQASGSQTWPILPGGILDRSNAEVSSLDTDACRLIAAGHTIREVRLQKNSFADLPRTLSFFADTLTRLSMANNKLVGGGYLSEELNLPALQELDLSNNQITSLTPLTSYLRASNLVKLDVSYNRVVSFPAMRLAFPNLTAVMARNNNLEDLEPDTIDGLKVVDVSNNDIAHLNPRLGLLGGTDKLEKLEVAGNRFRVPRWNIVERGTDFTLRWLRGRLPAAEMAEWKAKTGQDDDGDID